MRLAQEKEFLGFVDTNTLHIQPGSLAFEPAEHVSGIRSIDPQSSHVPLLPQCNITQHILRVLLRITPIANRTIHG
ncbi:hypothetical protein EI42_04817 [Thermosporothrix hazakensis]|uniref:Uncharacterized protein n=1 Tax=Thermosporothrix hazakensis TaxID=644383 RepID=A0A326U1G5_THEHA|nr:hypothetical protein EI42_04817 [Thermosporothrix hazakensis]